MAKIKSTRKITLRVSPDDFDEIKRAAAKCEDSVQKFCVKALRVKVTETLTKRG